MDVNNLLTPNFKLKEFLHNGGTAGMTLTIFENIRALAGQLEIVRKQLGGKPIHINSGFRTPDHNKLVGGVKDSQHTLGKAADITVDGMTPTEVFETVRHTWQGGIGHYPRTSKRAGWVHLDTGPKRFWEG